MAYTMGRLEIEPWVYLPAVFDEIRERGHLSWHRRRQCEPFLADKHRRDDLDYAFVFGPGALSRKAFPRLCVRIRLDTHSGICYTNTEMPQ